jgi:uracil-DNA glycosylase family 4
VARASEVARTYDDVVRLAASSRTLDVLGERSTVCRACPRLVEWRELVAVEKRRSYAAESYWGRPVPGWGAERPRVLIAGLAPAAHGGNRTGRIFTGDRSGDWLFASLHRVGLARLPTSTHADDGQELIDTRMVAAVRCAPPANKPEPIERDTCAGWFRRELELVAPSLRVAVALGGFAWTALWKGLREIGHTVPARVPPFGHGVEVTTDALTVLGCYHPSQQNTFTGRLTEPMLDAVLGRAAAIAHGGVGTFES